jgi:2-dehydro-3-deoxyphosphooctonate aldolase (KDO 8-P synthase)
MTYDKNIPLPQYLSSSATGNFFLLAGPCVIEGEKMALEIAEKAVELTSRLDIPYVFKGSYRKANRSRIDSFTGIGDLEALRILRKVGETFGIPTVTDIHTEPEAAMAAEYVDMLQIPAFLCRQTDLLVAAARTGRTVNIKKAQFLSGRDMRFPVEKAREAGAAEVWLTERGNIYGYNNLVVDFRNIPDMLEIVPTVIMDCTHSVQRPGGDGGKTGGDRRFVPQMAMAAKAFGATGYFFEIHPDPDRGLSDAANMLELAKLEGLVRKLTEQ